MLSTLEKLSEDGYKLKDDDFVWDSKLVKELTNKIDFLN